MLSAHPFSGSTGRNPINSDGEYTMAEKSDDGLVEITIRKDDLVGNGEDNGFGRYAKGDKARVTAEQAKALRALDYAD